MINQVNPGAVLPFFFEGAITLEHSRHIGRQADGWKILASNTQLIPFIFWEAAAPKTVDKFQVISLDNGKIYDLSTSLIDRRKRSDDSKTWYRFDGSDIGQVLPCGLYIIRVRFSASGYISDAIQVINAQAPEHQRLTATACASNTVTLTASDSIASGLAAARCEYRISDSTTWVEVPNVSISPFEYEIDMSAISLPVGENLLVRRTLLTDSGNTLQVLYSLDWDSGDPCGTYQFIHIDDTSTYLNGNLWYVEISDSVGWEDKVYTGGFTERVYLRSYIGFQEAERDVEILTDNNGNRVLNTADTRQFQVMEFEQIADHLIYILSAIGDYSTIYLKNVVREHEIGPLAGAETEFTFEPDEGGYYNRGRIRWRDNKHFETTCDDGETTVVP